MDAKAQVLEILGNYVDTPVDEIDTSAAFKFSAGLDSFALLSFIGALEEHFGITVPTEDLLMMTTLDDIIAYVEDHVVETPAVEAKGPEAPAPRRKWFLRSFR